jgi:hypothetical protein
MKFGETSRTSKTRFKERIQAIWHRSNAGYSSHIGLFDTGHAYDNINNTLRVGIKAKRGGS